MQDKNTFIFYVIVFGGLVTAASFQRQQIWQAVLTVSQAPLGASEIQFYATLLAGRPITRNGAAQSSISILLSLAWRTGESVESELRAQETGWKPMRHYSVASSLWHRAETVLTATANLGNR